MRCFKSGFWISQATLQKTYCRYSAYIVTLSVPSGAEAPKSMHSCVREFNREREVTSRVRARCRPHFLGNTQVEVLVTCSDSCHGWIPSVSDHIWSWFTALYKILLIWREKWGKPNKCSSGAPPQEQRENNYLLSTWSKGHLCQQISVTSV